MVCVNKLSIVSNSNFKKMKIPIDTYVNGTDTVLPNMYTAKMKEVSGVQPLSHV